LLALRSDSTNRNRSGGRQKRGALHCAGDFAKVRKSKATPLTCKKCDFHQPELLMRELARAHLWELVLRPMDKRQEPAAERIAELAKNVVHKGFKIQLRQGYFV